MSDREWMVAEQENEKRKEFGKEKKRGKEGKKLGKECLFAFV